MHRNTNTMQGITIDRRGVGWGVLWGPSGPRTSGYAWFATLHDALWHATVLTRPHEACITYCR